MKTIKLSAFFIFVTATFSAINAQAADGGQLFKQTCAVCHTIGKGKLVGPDLKGVDTRHSEAWILKWVKSSQTMVKAGDKDAIKLFNDNSNIPMPDQALKDDEIKSILEFIKSGGEQAPATATAAAQQTGPDKVTIETQKKAVAEKTGGSLLNMFSFTEYLLMVLMLVLLVIIWVLRGAIKSLTNELRSQEEKKIA